MVVLPPVLFPLPTLPHQILLIPLFPHLQVFHPLFFRRSIPAILLFLKTQARFNFSFTFNKTPL
jgi:hypothetical protein